MDADFISSNDQQALFQHFYNSASYMMGIAELDGDTIIAVHGNPAVAKLLGTTPDQIPGRTGEELGNPPDENRIWLEQYRRSQQQGGAIQFEYERPQRPGGQWLSATVSYLGTGTQDRPRFSFIAEDITGRKRMEEELARSERRYREIVQYAPTAIYEIDFRSGRFLSVNDTMIELTGYSREELLQMTASNLLDEAGRERFQERVRRWLAGEDLEETVEYCVRARDGQTIYATLSTTFTRDGDGSPIGATVVGHDITRRKRAEQAVIAAKEEAERNLAQLQAIIQNMDEGLIVTDQEGNMLLFNDAMLSLTGLDAFPKEHFMEYAGRMAVYDREGTLIPFSEWPIARALRGETVRNLEYFVQRLDTGKSYTALHTAAPVLDASGQVQLGIVTVHDITERKRAEEALQSAADRDAYRVRLSDALRFLSDPAEIQQTVSRLLGEYLCAGRVNFVEIVGEADSLSIRADYNREDHDPLAEQYRLPPFGDYLLGEMRAGRTLTIPDVTQAPDLSPSERAACTAAGVQAFVVVPLVRDGRLLRMLSVNEQGPRDWSPGEVAIIGETAERAWFAVGRAQAAAALRESEARLRETQEQLQLAKEAARLGIYDHDLITDTHQWDARSRELWGIGPDEAATTDTFLSGIHPDDRAAMRAALDRSVDPQGSGKYAAEYRVIHRGDHSERWISAAGQVYFENGRAMRSVGTLEDITARKRRELNLAFLADISRDIINLASPEDMLQVVGNKVKGYFGAPFLTFAGVDATNDELSGILYNAEQGRIVASGTERLSDYIDENLLDELRAGKPIAVDDIANDPRFTGLAEAYAELGIRSQVLAPFTWQGQVYFMVIMQHGDPYHWREDEIELSGDLAERLYPRIQQARAEEALRESERVRLEANERFRVSIDNLAEAFAILTAVRENGQIVDFRFEYANFEACRMGGLPYDQVAGHSLLEMVPEIRTSGLLDRLVQVVESGQSLEEQALPYSGDIGRRQKVNASFDLHVMKFGDGFILLADDVTEHARLETEHRNALIQMEIHHRLAEQREKERQSYARDIHDGPIQTLSSLAFNLQYLKETYPDPALKLELDQVSLSVKNAVQELRQVINELRPPSVIRFGLAKAIRVHVENLRERYPQIAWKIRLTEDHQLLPEQTCLALFRIYQEAVGNVIRHAEATSAWVNFRVYKNYITLEIRDNGKGLPADTNIDQLTSNQHFGLAGMSERVEAIHASLEITSKPGKGTRVLVKAPVKKD